MKKLCYIIDIVNDDLKQTQTEDFKMSYDERVKFLKELHYRLDGNAGDVAMYLLNKGTMERNHLFFELETLYDELTEKGEL